MNSILAWGKRGLPPISLRVFLSTLVFLFFSNFAQAAITQVGAGFAVAGAASTSAVLTKPTGIAISDVMLAQIAVRGGTGVTITPPTGCPTCSSTAIR